MTTAFNIPLGTDRGIMLCLINLPHNIPTFPRLPRSYSCSGPTGYFLHTEYYKSSFYLSRNWIATSLHSSRYFKVNEVCDSLDLRWLNMCVILHYSCTCWTGKQPVLLQLGPEKLLFCFRLNYWKQRPNSVQGHSNLVTLHLDTVLYVC